MARRKFNDGMEVVFQDFDKLGALSERELYDRVIFELVQRQENAFFGDSLKVGFVGPTTLSVSAGVGFQTDNTQVSPEPTKRLLYRSVSSNVTLSTPDGANDRIDIIVCKHERAVTANESRKYKATLVASPTNVNFDVETDWEAELDVVAGTPSVTPAVPSTPAGYIKLAEVLVSAVTGVSGSGAITDTRAKMPVGGDVFLNTLGFQRLTAGASVSLSTLLSDADDLLRQGYQNYTDFDVLGSDPAAPSAGKVRAYHKSGSFFFRESGGTINPLGSGGGGGGSAVWSGEPGLAPTEDLENGEKVWLFETGAGQELNLFVKVPQSYIAGRQITMYIGKYSPSAANTILLQSVAYLVRKNLDAITSVANSHSSGNSALTNTVANMLREAALPLTNATGQINGFSVSPGDIIKVKLTRGTDTDTADIRFLPSATEVKFG